MSLGTARASPPPSLGAEHKEPGSSQLPATIKPFHWVGNKAMGEAAKPITQAAVPRPCVLTCWVAAQWLSHAPLGSDQALHSPHSQTWILFFFIILLLLHLKFYCQINKYFKMYFFYVPKNQNICISFLLHHNFFLWQKWQQKNRKFNNIG